MYASQASKGKSGKSFDSEKNGVSPSKSISELSDMSHDSGNVFLVQDSTRSLSSVSILSDNKNLKESFKKVTSKEKNASKADAEIPKTETIEMSHDSDPDFMSTDVTDVSNDVYLLKESPSTEKGIPRLDIDPVEYTSPVSTLSRTKRPEQEKRHYNMYDLNIAEKPYESMKSPLLTSPTPRARSMADLSYDALFIRDPRKFKSVEYQYQNCLRFKDIQFVLGITMYNEDPEELTISLRGVCENIKAIAEKTENPEIWKKFVLVITSDGRAKINEDTALAMENAGLFDSNALLLNTNLQRVGAHMFQTTATFIDDPETSSEYLPLQCIFLLKEHNAGKIDSHWWFFEGICENLMPKYVILMDVGTRPLRKAFYHMYRCFERNQQISGICGELVSRGVGTVSTLVAAQHFEYKIASLLDRTIESVCGYISVLPGCFSAYRYETLRGQPLRAYFRSCEDSTPLSAFWANIFLVEDRVLCMELFAKADSNSTLHYERQAISEQDVPVNLEEFMKQRRRWINGTFLAVALMISQFWRILFHGNHSIFRKMAVSLDFLYYCSLLLSQWFLVGIYLLFMDLNLEFLLDFSPPLSIASRIFLWILVAGQFYCALNGKLSQHRRFYKFSMYALGTIYTILTFAIIRSTISGAATSAQWLLVVLLAINLGTYFATGLIHGEFITVILSFFQWWFMLPTYVIILFIYAFCNLNDVSWGTKSIEVSNFKNNSKEKVDKHQMAKGFSNFRDNFCTAWFFTNLILFKVGRDSYKILGPNAFYTGFFYGLAVFTVGFVLVRFFFSFLYVFTTFFAKRVEVSQNIEEVKRNRAKYRRNSVIISNQGQSCEIESADPSQSEIEVEEKSWRQYALAVVLFAPFRPTTWISMLNLFLLSPIFGLISIAWTWLSLLLSFLMIFTPLSAFSFGLSGISWRKLSEWEFSYNSFDGQFARSIGIEDKTKAGLGRHVFENDSIQMEDRSFRGAFRWMEEILRHQLTWKSFVYFLYVKPITLILSTGGVVLWLATSISLLVGPSNIGLNLQVSSGLQAPLSIIGALMLIISFQICRYVDNLNRRVTQVILGSPISVLRNSVVLSSQDQKRMKSP